jgi:hypothetical protein
MRMGSADYFLPTPSQQRITRRCEVGPKPLLREPHFPGVDELKLG